MPALYIKYVNVLISGKRRYNIKLWKTFTDCFNCLPVAAIVDEKIFCCHGGNIFPFLFETFFFPQLYTQFLLLNVLFK